MYKVYLCSTIKQLHMGHIDMTIKIVLLIFYIKRQINHAVVVINLAKLSIQLRDNNVEILLS